MFLEKEVFPVRVLIVEDEKHLAEAVAAVLIGGATAQRAGIRHVIIGTLIFQGLLATALPVANKMFAGTDLAEILRMVIQNGIILYALTQSKGGER